MRVETRRLTIVPLGPRLMRLRLEDYDAMQKELGVEPLAEPQYGDIDYERRVNESLLAVTKYLERSATGYLWYTFWQITSGDHQRLVGEFNFHGPPDEKGEVEFGYVVRPAYRKRGYATETVRAMVSWAFQQNGVTALVADTEPDNIASRRVLEKSGAQLFRVNKDVLRWKIAAP